MAKTRGYVTKEDRDKKKLEWEHSHPVSPEQQELICTVDGCEKEVADGWAICGPHIRDTQVERDIENGRPPQKLIYRKMVEVMAAVGAVSKDDKNEFHGYKYRSIDAVYNHLNPALIKAGVFCCPMVEQVDEDIVSGEKGKSFRITIKVRHRFYAEDGSFVDSITIGEAIDKGDKAAPKAMSCAYKYAIFETFCLPTEEVKDSEHDSPALSSTDTVKNRLKERRTEREPDQQQDSRNYQTEEWRPKDDPELRNAALKRIEDLIHKRCNGDPEMMARKKLDVEEMLAKRYGESGLLEDQDVDRLHELANYLETMMSKEKQA